MNKKTHYYIGSSTLFSNLTKSRVTTDFKKAEQDAIKFAKKFGGNPTVEYVDIIDDNIHITRTYNMPIA